MLRELTIEEMGYVSGGFGEAGSGINISVTINVAEIFRDSGFWNSCWTQNCVEDKINQSADRLANDSTGYHRVDTGVAYEIYQIGESNVFVEDTDGDGKWDTMYRLAGDVWRVYDQSTGDWRNDIPGWLSVLPTANNAPNLTTLTNNSGN